MGNFTSMIQHDRPKWWTKDPRVQYDRAVELAARGYSSSAYKAIDDSPRKQRDLQGLLQQAQRLNEQWDSLGPRPLSPGSRSLQWERRRQRLLRDATQIQAGLEGLLGYTPQQLQDDVMEKLPEDCNVACLAGCCPWFEHNYLSPASKAGRSVLASLAANDFPKDSKGRYKVVPSNHRNKCCRIDERHCLVGFVTESVEEACDAVHYICLVLTKVFRNVHIVYFMTAGLLVSDRVLGTTDITGEAVTTSDTFSSITPIGGAMPHMSTVTYASIKDKTKAAAALVETQKQLNLAKFAIECADSNKWSGSPAELLARVQAHVPASHKAAEKLLKEVIGTDVEGAMDFKWVKPWVTELLDDNGEPMTELPDNFCTDCRASGDEMRLNGNGGMGPGPFGPKSLCGACYLKWWPLPTQKKEELRAEAKKQGLDEKVITYPTRFQSDDGWKKGDPWLLVTEAEDGTAFGTPGIKFCTFCGCLRKGKDPMRSGPAGMSTLCDAHGKRWKVLPASVQKSVQAAAGKLLPTLPASKVPIGIPYEMP